MVARDQSIDITLDIDTRICRSRLMTSHSARFSLGELAEASFFIPINRRRVPCTLVNPSAKPSEGSELRFRSCIAAVFNVSARFESASRSRPLSYQPLLKMSKAESKISSAAASIASMSFW